MATGERSIRRADREPGKGSGHAEAHCNRERSTHATRKTHSCQTGKRHSGWPVISYVRPFLECGIMSLIRRIVGRFRTCFHHTSAGLQSCCGLFGRWSQQHLRLTSWILTLAWWARTSNLFVVWRAFGSCLLRFANAFSYYGLVLLTTELFQEGGACGSESWK